MIETERTLMKYVSSSDFEELLAMFNEPDAFKYIDPLKDKTKEEYISYLDLKIKEIDRNTGFYWVIRSKQNHQLVGAMNLTPIPFTEKIQIGWMIRRDFRKKGFAVECSMRIMKFAFEKTDFNPIYAVYEQGNIASEKILNHLSFALHETSVVDNIELITYIKNKPNQ